MTFPWRWQPWQIQKEQPDNEGCDKIGYNTWLAIIEAPTFDKLGWLEVNGVCVS